MSIISKQSDGNIQCSHKKLALNVLIHIVEACDIRSSITDYQIDSMLIECLTDFGEGLVFSDITYNVEYIGDGGSLL